MTGVQTCALDRKSTRLNSSHTIISYAVFCLKKKNDEELDLMQPNSSLRLQTAAASAAALDLRSHALVLGVQTPYARRDVHLAFFFFLMKRRPPKFTLFPYTTLFQ